MSDRFRVAFDGRTLRAPARGVRRYVWELYTAMSAFGDVDLFAVGVRPGEQVPAGVVPVPSRFLPRSNLAWSAVGLPFISRRIAFDVFHATAYTAPLFGVGPIVLTVHDVSYARHPEWYPYRRDPVRRAFYRYSATKAHAIVTDAEFTRGEIEVAYRIPPDRIHVVPLGVGSPFVAVDGTIAEARAGAAAFVLAVGDIHPRRNLNLLVRAVAAVRRAHAAYRRLTLLVVGADRGGVRSLLETAAADGASECLRIAGEISDGDLVALYRSAALVAYPSRYEGFGLPLLEAMACGAPVIASRASAVPETVGEAGLLVDAGDLDAWVRAITAVLSDRALARGLREAGAQRAMEYSWRRTAARTLDVLKATARQARS